VRNHHAEVAGSNAEKRMTPAAEPIYSWREKALRMGTLIRRLFHSYQCTKE
jgi:hypothetical protein